MSKRWWRQATGPAQTTHLRPRKTRGQALVELAIILPVLLLLVLAALDLGRIFYARIAVENAARAGAMEAAENPGSYSAGSACSTSNRIICAATREAQQGSWVLVTPADVTRTCSNDCSETYGAQVTVNVTGHFELLTPIMWAFTGGPNVSFVSTAIADIVYIPPVPGGGGPTATPTATPTPTPTPTATPTGSASATATPTPTPVPTPTCAPPAPAFSYSQRNRNQPVDFTGAASTPLNGSCAITFWRWDFGDGETAAGNLQTVSHDFPAQGATYQVTLTVTNAGSSVSYGPIAVTTLSR